MGNILTVIIATHNRAEEVVALYKDLVKQSIQDFNIVIMDDVSDEHELNKLQNSIQDDRVHIFSIPPPHRFAGDKTFNMLLREALKRNPKYIYNIHNDMKINSPDLLEKLVEYMELNDLCGAVAPTIFNGNGKMTWGPGIVKIRMGKEYIMNESYLVRAKCYNEMGLINEKLVYYGSEYYIFNWLRNNNYSTKILSDVNITHYGGGTSISYQNQKDYYRPRTSILIMKLFCQEDRFLRKLRYFNEELSEPKRKMKKNIRNFELLKLLRTLLFLFAGTVAGIFIRIKMNPPLNQS